MKSMENWFTKLKESEKKTKSHEATKITAKDRVKQYSAGTFHEESGLLFCTVCNVVLEHSRKSVLDRHLEAASHQKRLNLPGTSRGKQKTLKTSFKCSNSAQEERIKVCHDWIKVCTATNIPLGKSDHPVLREFLKSRVVNGGAIPKRTQLREYLFDVYECEKQELKDKISKKNVAVMVDELSDDDGRYVLDIMVTLLDFDELSPSGKNVAYLIDTHFLRETNNKTVSQAVVKTLVEYGIDFDCVLIFNSDNASYMKKAFNETLSALFPCCFYITCHSHIINLAAADFKKHFKTASEFIKCFRNLFYIPSGRKSRFLNFLKRAASLEGKPVMPPNPTTKSWSAWFESADYHAKYYSICGEFVRSEIERCGRDAASNSLLRLEEMYDDSSFMKSLHAQLMIISRMGPQLMILLDYFQQRIPHVTQAKNKMESLLCYLHSSSLMNEEDIGFCFEGDWRFESEDKADVLEIVQSAFSDAHKKLNKYVVEGGQPGSAFLEDIRVLDPRNLIRCDMGRLSESSIPGIADVPKSEIDLYVNVLGPAAVKGSFSGDLDLAFFWKSNAGALPSLYEIASRYCTATLGSYDVERSFSMYNSVLDDKRMSMTPETIRAYHFLNWNLQAKSAAINETAPSAPASKWTDPMELHSKSTDQVPMSTGSAPMHTGSVPMSASVSSLPMSAGSVQTSTASSPMSSPPVQTSTGSVPMCSSSAGTMPAGSALKSPPISSFFHPTLKPMPLVPTTKVPGTKATKPSASSKRKLKADKKDQGKRFRSSLSKDGTHVTKSAKAPSSQQRSSSIPIQNVKTPPTQPQVKNGLGKNTLEKLEKTEVCVFPVHNNAVLEAIVDGSVTFKGSQFVSTADLVGLKGGHPKDEANYLSNFVIDSYLKLVAETTTLEVETLEWETFEKGVASRPAADVVKGKDLMKQDYVLVPCNPGTSRHWFLLVVIPKQKEIIVLDSLLQGSGVKPTHERAVCKMWSLLEELSPSLGKEIKQWSFFSGQQHEVPQQQNSFDCGVYVCMYARCLVGLSESVISSDSIPAFRSQMVLELDMKKCVDRMQTPQEGEYYAVEYHKLYYIGRVLEVNSNTKMKFLYSVGARLFNWPKRDDIDYCSPSRLLLGPLEIQGSGPFQFPQLHDVEAIYQCFKKNRKKN